MIMDVCVAKIYKDKLGNEKTKWTRIGTYFESEDGRRSIELDALPVGDRLLIFPKKQQEQQTQNDDWMGA